MDVTLNGSVSTNERILRYIVGFGLIASALQFHTSPPWMTLVATYPVFTAIMGWDPFYSLYSQLKGLLATAQPEKKEKGPKRPAAAGNPA